MLAQTEEATIQADEAIIADCWAHKPCKRSAGREKRQSAALMNYRGKGTGPEALEMPRDDAFEPFYPLFNSCSSVHDFLDRQNIVHVFNPLLKRGDFGVRSRLPLKMPPRLRAPSLLGQGFMLCLSPLIFCIAGLCECYAGGRSQ